MGIIKVKLSQCSYEIHIGPGLLNRAGDHLRELGCTRKAVVITNPVVVSLYGEKLQASLEARGLEPIIIQVPDGEEYKTLEQAGRLYEKLNYYGAERQTPLLALGGGVTGDLGGFVAATYMRGVPLIHLPTTLLAQVDSSIGGKVAVNHGQLKNNIGTFYQPARVIADTDVLSTLPEAEFRNGLAEVIKYGIILDRDLFELLKNNMPPTGKVLTDVITRCAAIKAGIVEKDEKDRGLRNILNFGHTTGHAIETVSNLKLSHGQAVASGMAAAGMLSQKMGFLSDEDLNNIKEIITSAGLPIKIPGLPVEKMIQVMKHDKKNVGGKVRMVLIRTTGEAFMTDEVDPGTLEEVLEELYE